MMDDKNKDPNLFWWTKPFKNEIQEHWVWESKLEHEVNGKEFRKRVKDPQQQCFSQ